MARKKQPACDCHEHAVTGAPTEINGHRYGLDSERWSWWCSCGSEGRAYGSSPGVAYHRWVIHASK